MKSIIKIQNLNVTYFKGKPNEMHSLKNVDLEIFPGEFIIFFGPSGCGKSTLLYAISGLETNIEGTIFVDDKNIGELDFKDLERFHQQKIGMVFQAYYLITSLTVLKNVILPQVSINDISRKERKKRALNLLNNFGLEKEIGRFPGELSGGQQQRVAISRALINNPDILLADEPTGNLDSKSSDDVLGLFKKLNEEQNKTIILVTHNPANLDIAHRVFFMKDGEVTGVRENRKIGEKFVKKESAPVFDSKQKFEIVVPGPESLSKDFKLLEKSYSELNFNSSGSELLNFKTREIIFESLLGMNSSELATLREHVEKLLVSKSNSGEHMFHYLDDAIKRGGLGFDRRTAHNLTEKIKNIIKKIKFLEDIHSKLENPDFNNLALKIRLYLEDEFKIKFKNEELRRRFHSSITERLENKINSVELLQFINKPFSAGGVGVNIRKAKKISYRLELLILGAYNNKS